MAFENLISPVVAEKNQNASRQAPGLYLDRKSLDYFANDIRYNSALKNPKTSTFGNEKRFSFPSKSNSFVLAKNCLLASERMDAPAVTKYK